MWKIKLKQGQKLFFTSDTHYNHKNICRGVTEWKDSEDKTRPYQTLEHMNATIVNNINAVIGQDDILIHLGDWSFGGFESIKEFRDKIVCRNVYLIYGNHDHHIENNRDGCQEYFVKSAYYTVLDIERPPIKLSAGRSYSFVLMHFPICSWHNMNKERMHLFGHVHLPEDKKVMPGRSMDVGMDGNDLKPYELSEVIKLLKDREVETNFLPSDHHKKEVR